MLDINTGKKITLNELYQVRRMKDHSKKSSYERVLELAHRRIRNVNSYGGMNTFYEIPGMLVGFPLYNMSDCMSFVVEQLRTSGFLVQILPPPHVCVIYISWDPNELKPAPRRPALENGKAETHKPDKKQLRLTNGKYF